jgi:cobaltochelatase CobN
MLIDLKLKAIATHDDLEELEHHIKDIAETTTPFGLHTFGKSPEERYIRSTAEAIISIEKGLGPTERAKRIAALEDAIRRSGKRELDSFISALNGRVHPFRHRQRPDPQPGFAPHRQELLLLRPGPGPLPGYLSDRGQAGPGN